MLDSMNMTMVAAAAADVCSDPHHQHLQKLPWKQVLPDHRSVPTWASEPSVAPASPGRLTGASSSRARGARNRGSGETVGSSSSSSSSSRVNGNGRDGTAASKIPASAG